MNVGGKYQITTLGSMLGFNLSTWLRVSPPSGMAMTNSLPHNSNGSTEITTSNSQEHSVGLSANGGFEDGEPTGLVDADWSDSWSWEQSQTVDVLDWTMLQSGDPNAQYVYTASGNTNDNYSAMTTYYEPNYNKGSNTQNTGLQIGSGALNQLQQGNQISQSETDWETTGSLLAPLIQPQNTLTAPL